MKKMFKIIATTALSVLACATLFACVPSNMEKAKDKMKKEGYTITAYEGEGTDAIDGLVGGFIATKAGSWTEVDTLTALLFDDKDSAKDFYEDLNKGIQKGKWVYYGSEDAMEDFED